MSGVVPLRRALPHAYRLANHVAAFHTSCASSSDDGPPATELPGRGRGRGRPTRFGDSFEVSAGTQAARRPPPDRQPGRRPPSSDRQPRRWQPPAATDNRLADADEQQQERQQQLWQLPARDARSAPRPPPSRGRGMQQQQQPGPSGHRHRPGPGGFIAGGAAAAPMAPAMERQSPPLSVKIDDEEDDEFASPRAARRPRVRGRGEARGAGRGRGTPTPPGGYASDEEIEAEGEEEEEELRAGGSRGRGAARGGGVRSRGRRWDEQDRQEEEEALEELAVAGEEGYEEYDEEVEGEGEEGEEEEEEEQGGQFPMVAPRSHVSDVTPWDGIYDSLNPPNDPDESPEDLEEQRDMALELEELEEVDEAVKDVQTAFRLEFDPGLIMALRGAPEELSGSDREVNVAGELRANKERYMEALGVVDEQEWEALVEDAVAEIGPLVQAVRPMTLQQRRERLEAAVEQHVPRDSTAYGWLAKHIDVLEANPHWTQEQKEILLRRQAKDMSQLL